MHLLDIFRGSRSENRQFAVIGLGRFGRSVCSTLTKYGFEVMGIDQKEDLVTQATVDKLASHCIQLDSTQPKALQEAGIMDFETVVVAIGNFIEESIITTLNLKEGGVKYVVAKASSEVHVTLLTKVGADKVVFPEREMGVSLARALTSRGIVEKFELNTEYSVASVFVPDRFHNKTIRELDMRKNYRVNVLWIPNYREKGKDKLDMSFDPNQKLQKGTIIGVMGKNEDIEHLFDGTESQHSESA